jgi:hypothetical protein
MSTELRVELDAPPIIVSESVIHSRDVVANIIHLCHTLEERRDALLVALPNLEINEIAEVRMSARIVNTWSWLIECACDAEALARVEPQKGGRGKTDTNGTGRVAAAGRQAYLDGKGVNTVYKNARIIKTFGIETIVRADNSLQEKEFYKAALSAPDPLKAVEMFNEKKDANAFFEPKDAWELVNHLKQEAEKAKFPKPKKTGPHRIEPSTPFAIEMAKLHSQAMRAELASRVAVVKGWRDSAVDTTLERSYQVIAAILDWHANRDLRQDCDAIMEIFAGVEGTESPDCASYAYIESYLKARGRVMGDQLKARVETLKVLKLLTENSRVESKGEIQSGSVPPVYEAGEKFLELLDDISVMETRAEKEAARDKDWLVRLTRYAPELLPKKEEPAAA